MPAFCRMLERDRLRRGFTEGQVAWGVGVSVRVNRELVAGKRWPSFDTYDRICIAVRLAGNVRGQAPDESLFTFRR
jgi:hypothetical protein